MVAEAPSSSFSSVVAGAEEPAKAALPVAEAPSSFPSASVCQEQRPSDPLAPGDPHQILATLDELTACCGLTDRQRDEVHQIILDKGLPYALEQVAIVRSQPRKSVAGAMMTALRSGWSAPKSTEPPKEIWILTKSKKDEKILYTLVKCADLGRTTYSYQHLRTGRNLNWPRDVTAIILKEDNEEVRYDGEKTGEGAYRRFVGPDGWVIVEYDTGPAGPPERSSFWLWLVNALLNLFHFGLWFVCLWLLLRFQWAHALGLAVVLWLVVLLAVFPLLTDRTKAAVDQKPAARTTA